MTRIILVPLTSYGVLEYLDALSEAIREAFEKSGVRVELTTWSEVVKPPIKCFNWERRQYLANCVADYLHSTIRLAGVDDDTVILGVGYLDGFEEDFNFIFGLALKNTRTAVVFTKRLKPEFYGQPPDFNLYFERLVKECVHELGHLAGLDHCITPGCVMNYSNDILGVDSKSRFFCEKCSLAIKHYMSSTK